MNSCKQPEVPDKTPKPTMQARPLAETARDNVTVRVSVVNERHDEEEKEAGYGHGV